jgi:hypothetical protein
MNWILRIQNWKTIYAVGIIRNRGKGWVCHMRTVARIRNSLKKIAPSLLKAQEENINEADTVIRVVKVFEDVLGYDAMTEISREAQMKDKYVDIVLKIGGTIRLIIEVKAAGVTLRDRHIEQAYSYASRNNYRWVLLTNGVVWTLYHLTFENGIEFERAFSIDLLEDDIDKASEHLSLLQHDSIATGELEVFWERKLAMSPPSIAKALFHENVLTRIRCEVRRDAGVLIDQEDLAEAIRAMLSVETREAIGPMRIRKKRHHQVKGSDKAPIGKIDTCIKQESSIPPAEPSDDEKDIPI